MQVFFISQRAETLKVICPVIVVYQVSGVSEVIYSCTLGDIFCHILNCITDIIYDALSRILRGLLYAYSYGEKNMGQVDLHLLSMACPKIYVLH